jgi:hypothetical protein
MKVFFLNNDGGGFADQIDVAEGTTLGKLFAQRMPGRDAADYLIRLNRHRYSFLGRATSTSTPKSKSLVPIC